MKKFVILLLFSSIQWAEADGRLAHCLKRMNFILRPKLQLMGIQKHRIFQVHWNQVQNQLRFLQSRHNIMEVLSSKPVSFPRALALILYHLEDSHRTQMKGLIKKLLKQGLSF